MTARAPKGRETCRWCERSGFEKQGRRYGNDFGAECRVDDVLASEVMERYKRIPSLIVKVRTRWVLSSQDASQCPLFLYAGPEKKS